MLKLSIIALFLAPILAHASIANYIATMDESSWSLTEDTPIKCTLEHEIPLYGKGVFQSKASTNQNLLFTLKMWTKPSEATKVQLISRPPFWQPGDDSLTLGYFIYKKDFDGEVDQKTAFSMFHELERGKQPTFFYKDWNNRSNSVSVSLSAINFKPPYEQFKKCMAKLLPFSFEDISYVVLNYDVNDNITLNSQVALNRMLKYLESDNSIDSAVIDSYTDSYGNIATNQEISQKRAESIKEMLVSKGIDTKKIKAVGHGKTRHIGPNDTVEQRELNRRVVIKLSKIL